MNKDIFTKITDLINKNEISKAQIELSKLHSNYQNNSEYLFLRSKIFYLNKLYYLAIDTLFIALEFEENDEIYLLLAEIYKILGNESLSKKISDKNHRYSAVNEIKDTMTGLFRKKN